MLATLKPNAAPRVERSTMTHLRRSFGTDACRTCGLLWSLLLLLSNPPLRADPTGYNGPVPLPTDLYGATGSYAVDTRTFPSPDWPEKNVSVYVPQGAPGPRPTLFFAHGFAASDSQIYLELFTHLASHGWTVVFSPYPINGGEAYLYNVIDDGFIAAAQRYPEVIDTRKVGFIGHSYGGGATPALALRAFRDRGWGADARCLMLLAPWYSYQVRDADLASFPEGTLAVVQVYEDDQINDHRMAIDVFRHLNVSAANKDYLMVRSDRIDGYDFAANHLTPCGAGILNYPDSIANNGPAGFDALDGWGVERIAAALAAASFDGDPAAREVALGHGAAMQIQMGATANGRPLRPMTETTEPYPLFSEARYQWRFSGLLNPRRNEPPIAAPATKSRLSNVSSRAYSDNGEHTLTVGATITGDHPKELLVRVVGPTLRGFGIADPLQDPKLGVFVGPALNWDNDDWGAAANASVLMSTSGSVGAFPLPEDSHDAAALASFAPGALTVQAQRASGSPGTAVVELYDADLDPSTCLTNLSSRGLAQGNDNPLIAGFAIAGDAPLRVLIRGVGPTLAQFGIGETLVDPVLSLYQDGRLIAVNDDWSTQTDPTSVAIATDTVGAFELPTNSRDAALILALSPGTYTAQVRDRSGGTGVALVELYTVP